MYDAGMIVICCFISPTNEMRDYVRKLFPKDSFKEIFVKCEIKECIKRDPKGLYSKALNGEIKKFTGIDSPFETPLNPELIIDTTKLNLKESINLVLSEFEKED